MACDVRVENLTLPFIEPLDLGNWGIPLTLFGIVAVMNVVNFTDGVDGLAAGVCTIAAVTFAIIALSLDRDDAAVLAAVVAGASVGFLRHNFHPASVFMGDSGSNLLGLLLAVRGHPGRAEDGRRRGPVLPAGDPGRAGAGRHLRGGQAAQVPPARVLGRPLALPPPVRQHRLLRPGAPCSTCTPGPCRWPRWRWRCASCPTPRTTASSTPAGRS